MAMTAGMAPGRWLRQSLKLASWRMSIIGWIHLVLMVLVVNIVVSVLVGAKYGYVDGVSILHEGNCDMANNFNTVTSFAINALSSVLLSGSNYCLQCLTSPSREEVDRAHARGRTMEIGVNSVRNLRHLAIWKRLMWFALILSSVPLHLLYNSVISSSIAAHDYVVLGVDEGFLDPSGLERANKTLLSLWPIISKLHDQVQSGGLERLEVKDCISAYAQAYQIDRSNLVLVSTETHNTRVLASGKVPNSSVIAYSITEDTGSPPYTGCTPDPISWMCGDTEQCQTPCTSRIDELLANATYWNPLGERVDYCLSQNVDERCQIRFSLPLILGVMACNALKAMLMICLLLKRSDHGFHTIGDALSSFLARCDTYTRGCCLVSSRQFRDKGLPDFVVDIKYQKRRCTFSEGVTDDRWYWSLFFYWLIAGLSIAVLFKGVRDAVGATSLSQLFGVSLGTVSPVTTVNWNLPSTGDTGFAVYAIVSNLPQLALSSAYFTYNSMLTSMLASYEWSQMAWRRKGLRVSHPPQGHQRSTYFLHLPYRYSLPLICISILLHWLVSQSLFLITVTKFDETVEGITQYTCGWSPIAVLLVAIGSLGMIGAALTIGLGFHLKPGIPLSGTCSAVIASACYIDRTECDEEPLEHRKLRWGVIGPFNSKTTWGEDSAERLSFRSSDPSHVEQRTLAASNEGFPPGSTAKPTLKSLSIAKSVVSQLINASDGDTETVQHCALSSRPSGCLREGVHYA